MSPFETARQVYAQEPCARTFDEDLTLHLQHGFVFSTPRYFIMGRPVIRAADAQHIVDPRHIFTAEDCDTWHIYLLAGDPTPAWDIMPWPLAWFSFERRNELRFYPVDRIKRLSLG
jgi:hypothetical protein